jgi:hypothetical protein
MYRKGFPNEDILTKEIESWKAFADSLSSKEDRELFMSMLNDCYKYATAINAKGQLFSSRTIDYGLVAFTTHKMIDWLTKQISKRESFDNKKEVKESKEVEQMELGRENKHNYTERMKESIILMIIKFLHYYYHNHVQIPNLVCNLH